MRVPVTELRPRTETYTVRVPETRVGTRVRRVPVIVYRTVAEEFATTRPAFRWRQLAALARVTASEHGYPAPGVAEARRLLNI